METKLNIIFLANFLLFIYQRNTSEAAGCAVIELRAREQCGDRRVSQTSCEKQGCCWDRNDRGNAIACYSKKCKAGYFGWRCRFQCRCQVGETCDSVTGQCPSECPEDRWGIGCLLSSDCTYHDANGEHYKGRKTRTKEGYTCVQWSNQSYYGDSRFSGESRADAANFCRNPDYPADQPWCYYRLYRSSRGLYDYCTMHPCRCLRGRFGVNCESECHCSRLSENCQLRDGQCRYGCALHFTGPTCQACSDGWFGVNCRFQCNCKDSGEVCDNVNGRCQSGCRTNYAGDSCLMETPILTRPPVKESRTGNSITLHWLPWTRPPDLGEGPVSMYRVYYKQQWRMVEWRQTDSTQELRMVVGHLKPRVSYQFKVAPLHEQGFEGRLSPVATISTCSSPTQGPQDMHIETKDKEGSNLTTLIVTWQLPEARYWNCDKIVKYRVTHKAVRRPEYVHDCFIEIADVNMYENYTVSVLLINDANRPSARSSITYIARSGPVRGVHVSQVIATSVLVHWSAPSSTVGDLSHYSISYEMTQMSDCPADKVDTKPLYVHISSHQLTYELSNLQPHSQYRIAVWAETAAGLGHKTFTTVSTQPSVPTAEVRGLYRAEVRSFLARLAWQTQPCEGRNGPFLAYKYSVWQQGAPAVQYNGAVNVTEVRLVDLVPYTTYLAQVWYVNDIGEGPRCAPLEFRTLQSRPPAPRGVALQKVQSDSMIVSWQPPSPSLGVITAYEVKLSPLIGESHPRLITVSDHKLQHLIQHLTINTSYQVQVRAYTSVGPGPWSETLVGVTKESYPEKPGSLTNVSRTTNSITLRWTRPKNTNGELQTFEVGCDPVISSSMQPEIVVMTVEGTQHETIVEDLQSGRPYICSVAASTLKGYGPRASMTVWTKPLAPVRPGQPELLLAKSTDTTVSLRLHTDKQPSALMQSSRTYLVVVEELPHSTRRRRAAPVNPCGLPPDQLLPYEAARSRGYRCYVTAELGDTSLPDVFMVGDNLTYGGFHNVPLQKERLYNMWFGVVVVIDGETAVSFARAKNPVVAGQRGSAAGLGMSLVLVAVIATAVILILIAIIIVVMTTRRKTQTEQKQCQATSAENELLHVPPPIQASPDQLDSVLLPDVCCTEEEPIACSETALLCASNASQCTEGHSKPVALSNLCSYVKEKKAGRINELVQEFDDLPHGLRGKSDIAKDPENKLKNRYGNIIAYDHSRVVLDDHPVESSLGYINGNYIDGYKRPNAYIATQGPSKHTMGDIWKMAWQRNSHRVIMVTNLVEDGRRKCEQYWPDTDSATYGDFEVTKIEEEQYADFTIRVLNLTRGVITKTIRQFHFTSWPDHGVPMYATSLLAFRKKVRAFDDPTAGPMIVHCSAGVGRTGTFIALDYLLDQAKAEGSVDVINCVYNMRMRRVNMVQTQEQYVFVYDALLEAFKSGNTAVSCVDFRKRFMELSRVNPQTGKVRLLEEYELLQAMSPVNTTSSCQDAVASENISKNRNMQILPLDNVSRPYIQMYIPLSTDYINAVFSDGYKQRDAFIITQMPLPNTVTDFWAMMIDHKCKSIVMMNEINPADVTSACYFPDEGASWAFGPFTVKTVSVETVNTDVTIRNLTVTYNKKPGQMHSVQQFHYHGWPDDNSLPTSLSSLISLLSVVQRWQQRSGNRPIVVHCLDGATRSGLFCAVSYMVEHLKVEQEVDVFQSVKHVRINRPQLIPTFEQYKFLYEMAVEYMDCFETYSNFK